MSYLVVLVEKTLISTKISLTIHEGKRETSKFRHIRILKACISLHAKLQGGEILVEIKIFPPSAHSR